MKQYTDQGKVDTRSGFGALGLGLLLFAMVVVSSCCDLLDDLFDYVFHYDLFENEPKSDTPVFQYYAEYVFDDEFFCDTLSRKYSRFHYTHWFFPVFHPEFYGVQYLGNEENHTIQFGPIDYKGLSFNLDLERCAYVNDNNMQVNRQVIRFLFSGDGYGPFHEGVEYSWPDGFRSDPEYYPVTRNDNVYIYTEKWDGRRWGGATFKALSSSFKFKYRAIEDKCIYREIEDEYVRDVLDVFFDFELVIVGVPESWGADVTPNVGDTIRVKNGHFIQSLYCYDTDFLHQLIVPNEENTQK